MDDAIKSPGERRVVTARIMRKPSAANMLPIPQGAQLRRAAGKWLRRPDDQSDLKELAIDAGMSKRRVFRISVAVMGPRVTQQPLQQSCVSPIFRGYCRGATLSVYRDGRPGYHTPSCVRQPWTRVRDTQPGLCSEM